MDKLKEILEYYCGFRGTDATLIELNEELEKLYQNYLQEQPREDKLRLPTAICPKCNQFAFRIYKDHLEDNSHQCCNCQFIFKPQPPQSKLKERKIHEWQVSDEYGWRMVELWERDGQLELFATDKKGGNVESRV